MATNLKIRNIRARPVLAPFKRPPMSASGGIPSAALVLIDLETDGGVTGRAYVFGFAPWTLKPIVGCVEGLADMIKGDALAPLEIEAKLRKRLTLLDTPGLAGLALAGIDMAAWDALAIANGVPLVKLLGGELRPVRAYNSCGLWIQPVEKVADEAEQLVAEGNFSAVKLRIGRDDPAQDLAAARAVKKRVGDRISVMSRLQPALERERCDPARPHARRRRAVLDRRADPRTTITPAMRASARSCRRRSRPARISSTRSRWPTRSRSSRSTT